MLFNRKIIKTIIYMTKKRRRHSLIKLSEAGLIWDIMKGQVERTHR